jgi:hypothetical protein
VASVSYFDANGTSHELSAEVFVIAGSAIESARLCLLSGLSNPNIGRNLMSLPDPRSWSNLESDLTL